MTGTEHAAIRVDENAGIVEARFRGDVDPAALVHASRPISTHPGSRRGMHTLADFSASALRLDCQAMDRLRGYLWSIAAPRGDCRWAAVPARAPSLERVTLCAAMATAYEMRIHVRHLYATGNALAWIDSR